ncbi:MAG TPA: NAD(P)-dependent oxidoreductase [Caldilineaceae bacterium]|nr:NAD(P)-dependent oxidoreductase [Caldilineaceae bacterium]
MILVTGGTGLTGQFVVEELLRRGQAVRVLARAQSLASVQDGRVEPAPGDLADLPSLRRAMTGVSGVVHAACTFTDSAVDIAAMQTLLAEWRTGPFVFISSLDVYGWAQATPIDEEHPLSETYSDYGRGKVVCERLLDEAAARVGRADFAMLRAPYIWGPHPKARERLVNQRLATGQPIILPGATPAEWAEYQDVWIDVRDLAWIVAEVLENPPGGPLNVLSGHFIWHDLYAELIRLTGSSSSLVHKPLAEIGDDELPRKQIYAQRWHFSAERLQEQAPFTPRYTLAETLAATAGQ